MMKKTVRSLIFVAILVIAATFMLTFSAAADVLDGTFHSTEGTLNWAFLENGGTLEATGNTYKAKTLIIYGTGTSYTYSGDIISGATATQHYPWGANKDNINNIVIEAQNLTSFGYFRNMNNLKTIIMPASIKTIGSNALYGCKNLYSITVLGESYPAEYGNSIFDFRYVTELNNSSLQGINSENAANDITVLFGEGTTNTRGYTEDKQYFFEKIAETVTVYCYKGTVGETHITELKKMLTAFPNTTKIAKNITIVNYPEEFDPSALNKALTFEGYQVRTKVRPTNADPTKNAENGLRTIYNCDSSVVNEGYTLVEYGTILSTKENAEYAFLDPETLEASQAKIVKSAVYKNGEIVGVTLKDNEDGKVKFATTIINFRENYYSAQICARGYEVWAKDGTNYILYSDSYYADDEVYYPSLCDVTINCFAYGIINSADQDENEVLWKVLDTCRFELTEGTTEYSGGARIYELEDNVITVSERSTDPNFSSNDMTIQVFETENNGLVAIVRGTGKAYRTTEMLKSCCNAAVETIVYDDGLTAFGFGDFKNNADVKYVVYPDTLVGTGTEVFNKAPNITAVSKVKTMRVDGLIDLSYLDGVGFSSSSYLFAGVSSSKKENIEYIYLPSVVSDKAITILNDFTYITNLKAVWCVGNIMIEGKVNFEGTNITGDEKAFANSGISAENIIWGTEPVVEETPVE